jgi:hypothetical protein
VRVRRAAVVAIALALASRHARAQDSLTFKGADRETRAALVKIVSEASARGLPSDHIVSKVQFALVVHAPPARILETAQAVADRLDAARGAIASDTLSADIAAGEDALSFKIPKDILTRIHAAAPNRPIAVPIGLLTQLVANAVPAEHAGKIVVELMRRGASPMQFANLGNDVNSDVQRGARGAESADIRLRGLNPLLPPGGGGSTGDFGASSPASSGPRKP